jgi:maltose alpha-D-glucosyltransferase/alpha-amylase
LAVRREDSRPLIDCIESLPAIPAGCQWATFLRNHDELTLEMVTDSDRDYLYSEYARDPRMKINLGIRRRLAPLVDHDRRRIELLYSLLLSLPGSPVIYYGDEIGMGDNIYLGDRNGVRTPMQWSDDRNAGFSSADPSRLYQPVLVDPLDHYQAVNVEAQLRSPASLLHWMRHQLRLRRSHPVFSRGDIRFLNVSCRSVVAFLRSYRSTTALLVHNLSAAVQPVHLELAAHGGMRPVHVSGNHGFPVITADPYFLNLAPYESLWFLLEAA